MSQISNELVGPTRNSTDKTNSEVTAKRTGAVFNINLKSKKIILKQMQSLQDLRKPTVT